MTSPFSSAPRPLDLLVLGGTCWLGGSVARAAVARGHRVTCLARGESGEPPDDVTWVRADRREPSAYDAVSSSRWDAVLEVSWQPDFVRSALEALGPLSGHWVYVSSCSVYADEDVPDTDESAPLREPHLGTGPVDWEVYGPAKVACEQATLARMGQQRTLVARAGLIGGYGDRSDRLGYWPARVARATDDEPVLVPPRDAALQVIDVQDLAAWLVSGVEQSRSGVFNTVGEVATVGDVLEACAAAARCRPRFVEATDSWLVEQQVEPWAGTGSLPLWLPDPDYAGFMTRRGERARRAGLVPRPLADTVRAALQWERERGLDRGRRAGLAPERESGLLARLSQDE